MLLKHFSTRIFVSHLAETFIDNEGVSRPYCWNIFRQQGCWSVILLKMFIDHEDVGRWSCWKYWSTLGIPVNWRHTRIFDLAEIVCRPQGCSAFLLKKIVNNKDVRHCWNSLSTTMMFGLLLKKFVDKDVLLLLKKIVDHKDVWSYWNSLTTRCRTIRWNSLSTIRMLTLLKKLLTHKDVKWP